jgi:hypothetical protein
MSDPTGRLPFRLSEPAVLQIRFLIERSGCASPVASIGDSAGPGPSAELKEAVVGVYEVERSDPADLADISGMRFAMPPALRDFLHGFCLDCEGSRFLRHDPVGTCRGLMSATEGAA